MKLFKTGSIIGAEQFMWDEAWTYDVICRDEDSVLAKLDWEDFLKMKEAQP